MLAPDRTLERPTEVAATLALVPGLAGGLDLRESRSEREGTGGAIGEVIGEVILGRIAGLAIRYYGAPSDGARPLWQQSWSRTDRAPLLVEIQVAFLPQDRRRWPPLLIALEAGP